MSDIHALSGAYAVDALDDVERAQFEQHLAGVPRVPGRGRSRSRETAALIAETTSETPAGEPARLACCPGSARSVRCPPRRHPPRLRPTRPPSPARCAPCAGVPSRSWWRPRWPSSCWRSAAASSTGRTTAAPRPRTSPTRSCRRPTPSRSPSRSPTAATAHAWCAPPSLERAVMVGQRRARPAGRHDVPAVAPAARPGHGLGRPDAGRRAPDGAHRATPRPPTAAGDHRRARGRLPQPTPTRSPSSRCRRLRRGTARHEHRRRRVAVIGSGVAGLTAAHVAAAAAHVTLYEADDRLGGHADTHDVSRRRSPIDTGFIVHNERTYPTLLRLFAELGVPPRTSEMSMSVRDDDDRPGVRRRARRCAGCSRPGATSARPAYLRMLTEIPRFHRRARALLEQPDGRGRTTRRCGDFLADGGFSAYFRRHFMEPLVAAVWSCDPAVALDYPARYLFEFLAPPRDARRSSARRSGAPSSAARASTSRGSPPASTTSALGTKVTSVLETADRRRGHRRQRRGHDVRRGRGRHPPRPGAGHAGRADRRPSARCSARCPTPPTPRCCTPTPRVLPARRAAPGRRGTSCARAGDRGGGHRHLRPDPAAAAADTDDPLPRHPRRRGPRRPAPR